MKKHITALALIITCSSCQKNWNCTCRNSNDSGYVAKQLGKMDKDDATAACRDIDLQTVDSCYAHKASGTF